MMRKLGILVLTTLLLASHAASAACFKYETKNVTLTGTLVMREYFLLPEYGNSPPTDTKVQNAILMLDRPICTDKGDVDEAEVDQGEITLSAVDRISMSGLNGKHVSVKGTLLHATSRNHHTPLLLVLEVRPVELR